MVSKSELISIKHLRQPFEAGRDAIEKLVVLARKILKDLDNLLRDNMAHGIFSSTRLERIFIP